MKKKLNKKAFILSFLFAYLYVPLVYLYVKIEGLYEITKEGFNNYLIFSPLYFIISYLIFAFPKKSTKTINTAVKIILYFFIFIILPTLFIVGTWRVIVNLNFLLNN